MGSSENQTKRPHAVFMPFPAQGHMNPLLKLAKLLHSKGFFITFIHTALYHRRLLRTSSSSSVSSSASFRFVTIDDGVSEDESTHTLHYVQDCMRRHCPASLRELLVREEDEGVVPPATCIVSDGVMSFTLGVAEELRLPQVLFWTMSACGFMGYLLFEEIIKRDMAPLKDDVTARNDARLDARIDWVPAMKNARLRDMPTFITHPSHPKHQGMLEFMIEECRNASRATAIVLNTFDALELPVLDAISASLAPPVLTVGPLMGLNNNKPIFEEPKVWQEEMGCLKWLEAQQDSSVLYINFGSIAVMTSAQLSELAFGIAGSGCRFLWVVRPDSVDGGLDGLPAGFVEETMGRGLMIMGWCPQEEVLGHRAVGGFMTHSGWNSMLESVVEGVPMACLPSVAEQPTNSRFACGEWAVGLEIGLIGDLERERVEGVIRELMEGEKGREIRKRALEVKEEAWKAVKPGGSSYVNLDKLVYDVLKAPMTLNG